MASLLHLSPQRPPSLNALTGLRFFAALGVVLFHLDVLRNSEVLGWVYTAVLSDGCCGVGFFFILSGFVLAYNYDGRFRALRGRELWDYATARFARIYPLHFVLFGIVLIPYFRATPWPGPGL